MITAWILIANYLVDKGPGTVVIPNLPSYEECRRVDAELRSKTEGEVVVKTPLGSTYTYYKVWTDSLCLEARKQK